MNASFANLGGINATLVFFSLGAAAFVTFFAYYSWRREKKSVFDWITIFLAAFTILFSLGITVTVFSPNKNLVSAISYLMVILLPTTWFLGAVGIIVYGLAAIITRQTYAKIFFLPGQLSGLGAIYLGIIWVLAGLMMLWFEFTVIGYTLCQNNLGFCWLPEILEKIFQPIGNLMVLMSKPLQWLGWIK